MNDLNLIDSHAHLDLPEFARDFDSVLIRATAAGIHNIVTIGIDIPSSKKAIELAIGNQNIYATVGIHPNEASTASDTALEELAKLANHPRVVGIGETGLDFYHQTSSEDEQIKALKFQLYLAVKTGKPLVIHSRQAEEVITPILLNWSRANALHPKGVIHCFNGSGEMAEKYLNAGFYLALGGFVTYPSSRKNYELYRSIPMDRLLLETDCPFLPPQTHRGQRNEPSYLVQTAQTLATIKGIRFEELARMTSENARKLFNLP